MRHWIKLYTEIVHDPKMGRLTDRQFRTCMNLFALAGDIDAEGALPSVNDMAWQLRMAPDDLAADLQALAAVNIMALVDATWVVVKWAERQERAPSASREKVLERVHTHRERTRNEDATTLHTTVKRDVTTLDKNRVDTETDTEGETETEGTRGDAPAAPPQPPASQPARKAPEILPAPAQAFLEHGGKFPTGKLTDGTTKKARAIAYICDHVPPDTESLALWGRVVAGYCAQWSARSYTIMVQDYYLRNKVPGDHSPPPGRNNGNGYEHPALQALRMVQEEQAQHGNE